MQMVVEMEMAAEVGAVADVEVDAVEAAEDVVEIKKNDTMKKNLIPISSLSLLLLPFAFSYYAFGKALPYSLNGPQFIKFYITLCIVTMCTASIWFCIKRATTAWSLFAFTMLLGVTRLFQGIYNHKPVGYLILILITLVILFGFIKNTAATLKQNKS